MTSVLPVLAVCEFMDRPTLLPRAVRVLSGPAVAWDRHLRFTITLTFMDINCRRAERIVDLKCFAVIHELVLRYSSRSLTRGGRPKRDLYV